MQDHVGCLELT